MDVDVDVDVDHGGGFGRERGARGSFVERKAMGFMNGK